MKRRAFIAKRSYRGPHTAARLRAHSFGNSSGEAVRSEPSQNECEFQTRVLRLLDRFGEKVDVSLLFREKYTLPRSRQTQLHACIECEVTGSCTTTWAPAA